MVNIKYIYVYIYVYIYIYIYISLFKTSQHFSNNFQKLFDICFEQFSYGTFGGDMFGILGPLIYLLWGRGVGRAL